MSVWKRFGTGCKQVQGWELEIFPKKCYFWRMDLTTHLVSLWVVPFYLKWWLMFEWERLKLTLGFDFTWTSKQNLFSEDFLFHSEPLCCSFKYHVVFLYMRVCIRCVSMTNHMLQSVFYHVHVLQWDSARSTYVLLNVTLRDFSFFITLTL